MHDEAAKAASATNHRNICVIHDIEQTDDGQLFIVMAHDDGQTLKQKLVSFQLQRRTNRNAGERPKRICHGKSGSSGKQSSQYTLEKGCACRMLHRLQLTA
jgi:hypothetical protein